MFDVDLKAVGYSSLIGVLFGSVVIILGGSLSDGYMAAGLMGAIAFHIQEGKL